MSKVRIEIDDNAIRSILKSAEMQKLVENEALQVVSRAGGTFDHATHVAETRVYASVYPTSYEDILENSKNNTLLKALNK